MRFSLVLLYTVLIATLSLAHVPPPGDLPGWLGSLDKVAHFGMYGLYALILMFWKARSQGENRQGMILAVLWATFYGMLMEILQAMLPQQMRDFSWGDFAANALGALAGVFVWRRTRFQRWAAAK